MSLVLNAVNSAVNFTGKQLSGSPQDLLTSKNLPFHQGSQMKKLGQNMNSNFSKGGEKCASIGQCRDVSAGIAQGDFKKVAVNSSLLAAYLTPAVGASAGMKQGYSVAGKQSIVQSVTGMSMVQQQLQNSKLSQSAAYSEGQPEGGGTANPTGDSVEGNIKNKKNKHPINWMKDPVGIRPWSVDNSIVMGSLEVALYAAAGAVAFKGASMLSLFAVDSLTPAQRQQLVTLSREGGDAIVAASAIVKFPQVFEILRSGTVQSISPYTTYIETAVYIQAIAAAKAHGLPFSRYGDNLVLTGYNALIMLMLWGYSKKTFSSNKIGNTEKVLAAGFLGSWAYTLLTPGLLPAYGHQIAATSAAVMCTINKIPQMAKIYSEVGTGALSLTSTILLMLLGIVRLATMLADQQDSDICYWAQGANLFMNFAIFYLFNYLSDMTKSNVWLRKKYDIK